MISRSSNSITPSIPIPPPVSGSQMQSFSKTLYGPAEPFSSSNGSGAAGSSHSWWPSRSQALPDLNANGNAVAIQHIKVKGEGWERNHLKKPTKP
jgi:hypothetical protein